MYARVSTERQEQLGTVASQLAALRDAARRERLQVIEEFVDDGYSGARLDRPALDRLRDAAEAGLFEQVLCLAADRLARAYAHQVLILEEFERFGVRVRFLDGPAPTGDPQAKLLVQVQGVIAEYERAKIAERYRRGKLHRAKMGEPIFWKVPYGYRRTPRQGATPARIHVFEPEAEVVREIFRAYLEDDLSVRQIALRLHERGIPSPTGKAMWGTSSVNRLLRNEAYVGTLYYNQRESLPADTARRGRRHRNTRTRTRPKEEWIALSVPSILDPATFTRAQQVSRDNSKFNPRGAEPGHWLLRGLVQCGHCRVGCNCHKMRGRNGTYHRYYYCCNHDLLRAGSEAHRCPERNIRSDPLDAYVFEQVRQALLHPDQLTAGERATDRAPTTDEQVVKDQLQHLQRRLAHAKRERERLLDAYQAGLIALDNLHRRARGIDQRRATLESELDTLHQRRAELAQQHRLHRHLASFAHRIATNIDQLDHDARRKLLRLVIEKITVTGWDVEIHLKIPLANEPGPPTPPPTSGTSSDMRLRSHHQHQRQKLQTKRPRASREPPTMTRHPTPHLVTLDVALARRTRCRRTLHTMVTAREWLRITDNATWSRLQAATSTREELLSWPVLCAPGGVSVRLRARTGGAGNA